MDDIRAEIDEILNRLMKTLAETESDDELKQFLALEKSLKDSNSSLVALLEKKIREARIEAIEKLSPYLNNKLSVEGQIMMTEVLAELEQLKDSKGQADNEL